MLFETYKANEYLISGKVKIVAPYHQWQQFVKVIATI